MTKYALVLLPVLLGGCQAIGDWADRTGDNLPTIGERCEHWQCMTEEGQKKSEQNKQAKAKAQAAAVAKPAVTDTPAPKDEPGTNSAPIKANKTK